MRNFFRVKIPKNIDDFLKLTQQIISTHENDGASSVLNSLNMLEMKDLYTQAQNLHLLFQKEIRDKQTAFENRNLALGIHFNQFSYTPNTILFYIGSIRDYLLGIYKNKEQMLGNWGYDVNMSNGFVSVKMPRKAVELLALGNQIYQKHESEVAMSVLNTFDMAKMGNLLQIANSEEQAAKQLLRSKETNFQLRNNVLGFGNGKRDARSQTLLYYVTAVRNVLLGIHKSNEKQLGKWGFEVDNSPRKQETEASVLINGTVQDKNTQLSLTNIDIELQTTQMKLNTTTDAMGNFEFELKITAKETVILNAMVNNYLPFSKSIVLKPNSYENVLVEMETL